MALGKGLDSLIPPKQSPMNIQNQVAASEYPHSQDAILHVPTTAIQVNPHQPRHHFSHQELEELISSIKEHGILQPLLVSRVESGYELIAGERRLRASRIAGLATVPVIVRDVAELEKVELALIENIQRSDLNAIEKAEGYNKLIHEFGLNHEEAAKKLGISRSTFSNTLRLMELPTDIQKALSENNITEGHAKILLGLASAADQMQAYQMIMRDGLSVRKLQEVLQGKTKQARRPSQDDGPPVLPLHLQSMQQDLMTALSTRVTLQDKGESGSINIKYYSREELSEIVKRIISQNSTL